MHVSPMMMLILAIMVAVTIYLISVMAVKQRKQRTRALKALYFNEQQEDNEIGKFTPYAEFCRDAISMLGINIAEQRKKNYNEFGRAGLITDADIAKYLFFSSYIKNLIYILGGLFLAVVILNGGLNTMGGIFKILVASGIMLFVIMGPMSLDKMAKKRRINLMLEFPDAVDLLLVCVESGMGLDAAIGRVCQELGDTHPNISAELRRTKLELGVYGDRVQALLNLAERTDIQSFRSLVSALVQTEKYGTNLASTLRVLSGEYRTERLLNAEQKAAKVGALLTLPVVIGVFFPVMALIMSPPFITIFAQGGLFGGE